LPPKKRITLLLVIWLWSPTWKG